MARWNLIWLMIDAMRNYPPTETRLDPSKDYSDYLREAFEVALPLGKLPIIDELAPGGIKFTNAVTSALSTQMAVSAQLMGLPAHYISRNYNDFLYDKSNYDTISDILRREGYNNYGISFAIDLRFRYKGLIDHVGRDMKPKGLNERSAWPNDAVMYMFHRLMKRGVREPYFLFIHINARRDPQLSLRLADIMDNLSAMDGFDESIFIVTADHGAPDPVTRDYYYYWLERNNIPTNKHDLIGTDDNVLIPFILKYPGCSPQRIATHVGVIDIVPTVVDLLGVDFIHHYGEGIRGMSLLPLIKGENLEEYRKRYIRTDARYITQNENLVALRGEKFKYIITHNLPYDEPEMLYDLEKDPLERTNLINSEDPYYREIADVMREEYRRQEAMALRFHQRYLVSKFKRDFPKVIKDMDGPVECICIVGSCNTAYLRFILGVCKECFPYANIRILSAEPHANIDFDEFDGRVKEEVTGSPLTKEAVAKSTNGFQYDLTILPLADRLGRGDRGMVRVARSIPSKRFILVDTNMDLAKSIPGKWVQIIRLKFRRRLRVYRYRPTAVLRDFRRVLARDVQY